MKPSFLIIPLVYLVVNIIFNFRLWKEAAIANPANQNFGGESIILEFPAETYRENLLNFKNPFAPTDKIFYPFETNFALNDPSAIHGFYFLVLRPFFTTHQSLTIIVVTSIFLANIGMYLLLRKLGIGKPTAFLFGLVYGFMPFLSWRILGHYTYTNVYLFPWLFLIFSQLISSKNLKSKLLLAAALAILVVVTLWTNFYYTIIVTFLAFFYFVYFFLFKRNKIFEVLGKNLKYFVFSIVITVTLLIPWLIQVKGVLYFDGTISTLGFGGAQILSVDLLGFFTPSQYNPFYHFVITQLGQFFSFTAAYSNFFINSKESFGYIGIIIIFVYLYLALRWRKIPVKVLANIKPHFFISLIFLILTLGPFLKIANSWFLTLEEGIRVFLPLPFLFFHYLPILDNLRAPARFLPGAIFTASIVGAYLIEYLLGKLAARKRTLVVGLLLVVFVFDQFYIIPARAESFGPEKIYSYVKAQPDHATVLEIPFTARDGFSYIGFVHAIEPMNGQLIHGKPIIGGYLGRVYPYVFDYYKNLEFINSLAKVIDKGNYDPTLETPRKNPLATRPIMIDMEKAVKEIEFLKIKYIILKNDEDYSNSIKDLVGNLGFVPKLADGSYALFIREPKEEEYLQVNVGTVDDYLFLGQGFSVWDNNFRWVDGKIAKVMFKINKNVPQSLKFTVASFNQPQKVKVYINGQFIGEKLVDIAFREYNLPVFSQFKTGINNVTFIFSQAKKPSEVLPGSQDSRDLSARFSYIALEDLR